MRRKNQRGLWTMESSGFLSTVTIFRGEVGLLAGLFALASTVAAGAAVGGEAPRDVRISFDTTDGLTCKPGYKCVEANAEMVADDVREGSGAVKTTWKSWLW